MTSRRSLAAAMLLGAVVVVVTPTRGPEAAPRPQRTSATCIPISALSREDAARYERFNVLPRLYGRWMAAKCVPPRIERAALDQLPRADGVVVHWNGRDAFAVEPEADWVDACTGGPIDDARIVPATGAELAELLDRMTASSSFGDVDVLEVGLARAFTSSGSELFALRVGTLERSVQLRCYDGVAPMVDQAGRIFRDDRESVDRFYDFLTIERSTEPVAIGAAPAPAPRR